MSLLCAVLPNLIYLLKTKLELLAFHIQCVQTFSVLSHPPHLPDLHSDEFRAAFAAFIHFHLAILPSPLHLIQLYSASHRHSPAPLRAL